MKARASSQPTGPRKATASTSAAGRTSQMRPSTAFIGSSRELPRGPALGELGEIVAPVGLTHDEALLEVLRRRAEPRLDLGVDALQAGEIGRRVGDHVGDLGL